MLPFQNRLKKRVDFERVKKEGRKFQYNFFAILITSSHNKFSRLGFIISTKVAKQAVRRNKARRLLSEAITPSLPELKPGFDIVFLCKKELLNKRLVEVKEGVDRALKEADLIK